MGGMKKLSDSQKKFRKMMRDFKKSPTYKRMQVWDKFFELNPQFCPHTGVIAPVNEDGSEAPGLCLTCGTKNVTNDMVGEYPEHDLITYSSSAQTLTTSFNFYN